MPKNVNLRQTGGMANVLDIKVDIDGPMRACKILREEQLPFTIARALTMTAMDARDAVRTKEGEVFELRNDWTQKRTLTKMATKTDLTAQVYTDTENRRTGAPDYMPMQEDGGTKRPNAYSVQWRSQGYLAVPTKALRRICPGPIPAKWRPSQMLLNATMGPLTRTQTRQRRAMARDGMYYFIVRLKSSALFLMGRAVADAREAAIPYYILITSAHLRGRHPVDETVEVVVEEKFAENFSKAATEIAVNNSLQGTGVRVKL